MNKSLRMAAWAVSLSLSMPAGAATLISSANFPKTTNSRVEFYYPGDLLPWQNLIILRFTSPITPAYGYVEMEIHRNEDCFAPDARPDCQAENAYSEYYVIEKQSSTVYEANIPYKGRASIGPTAIYRGGYFEFTSELPGSYTLSASYEGEPAPTPEPATWALMVIGFGAVGAAMRKRQPVIVAYA